MHTFVYCCTDAPEPGRLRRVVPKIPRTMCLLCFLTAASTAQAATVQLEPLADNWISSCSSNCTTNYGDTTELRVRTSWWGPLGSREPKNFRSLLQFDLSSVPAPADRITDATLRLYYYEWRHADPVGRVYEVHRLTNTWDETHSTWQARDDHNTPDPVYWDSYDSGVPPYQPGGGDFAVTVDASAVVPAGAGQWMSWDVTDLVKEWVGGTCDNVGLTVKDGVEIAVDPGGGTISHIAKFRSREYADGLVRPYLEVTYEDDGEPIPTMSEWGLVIMTLLLLAAGTIALSRYRTAAGSYR